MINTLKRVESDCGNTIALGFPEQPLLIDEDTYNQLRGQDREDYVQAVKMYNKTRDECFRNVALYFEAGRNGVGHSPEFKQLQRRIQELNKTLSFKQINRLCGGYLAATSLGKIAQGYTRAISAERIPELTRRLTQAGEVA